ncbi:hypothetical protein BKA57DRAFT_515127 [Linnemannia elongata]|nr:hypothetical protein BKA57DRAFT_515127 [Linnemannia elongata]
MKKTTCFAPSLPPTMNTHPLSLYEIVLAIGQFIPLWESVHLAYEDVWLLKPKDLLAAISVNRLFRTTLTPLLWSVYVEFAVMALGNAYKCIGNAEYEIPVGIVQKNSSYIRFLDLSSHHTRFSLIDEPPELNCSLLQELRLSADVDSAWAKRLILANPELRVLHWERNRKNLPQEKLKDFASILSLQRLRYLGLDDWTFLTEHLYRALAKNAGHLEELRLTRCDSILLKRSKRDGTGKSQYTVITSMETGVEESETIEQMCRRIRLTKLKTLHLDVEHNRCPLTLYWLIDIAPALETAVFGDLLGSTGKALSLTLRGVAALHLLNACAPGHLVHTSLRGLRLDNTFMEALSVHRDCLETLELDIRDDNYRDSFSNLGAILEQCSQLKHLAVEVFCREPCDRRQPLLFLNKLVTCPGLESLTFKGFRLAGENNHLHEGDEDYGSNEVTSRGSIEWDPEFENYHDLQADIWPGWREVYLAFSDASGGWCSAHFKRIVGDAIGSLSSLKYVRFDILSYGKWRKGDEGVCPLVVAGDGNFIQAWSAYSTVSVLYEAEDQAKKTSTNATASLALHKLAGGLGVRDRSEDHFTMDRRSIQCTQCNRARDRDHNEAHNMARAALQWMTDFSWPQELCRPTPPPQH